MKIIVVRTINKVCAVSTSMVAITDGSGFDGQMVVVAMITMTDGGGCVDDSYR